jgi:homoserine dehydrogenase
MDAHKQLTIGLFGFGVVGEGLYKVMHQTPSLNATIKKSASNTRARIEMLQKNFSLQIGMYC